MVRHSHPSTVQETSCSECGQMAAGMAECGGPTLRRARLSEGATMESYFSVRVGSAVRLRSSTGTAGIMLLDSSTALSPAASLSCLEVLPAAKKASPGFLFSACHVLPYYQTSGEHAQSTQRGCTQPMYRQCTANALQMHCFPSVKIVVPAADEQSTSCIHRDL